MKSCCHSSCSDSSALFQKERSFVVGLAPVGFFLFAALPSSAFADTMVPPASESSLVIAYSLRSIDDVPESARATYFAEGILPGKMSRGPGMSPTLLVRGFSANEWSNPEKGHTPSYETALAQGDYYEFGFAVARDFEASLATLDVKLRRSGRHAPMFLEWQYSLDGFATPGVPIVANWLNFDPGGEPTSRFGYFARAFGDPPASYEPFEYMFDWRGDPAVSEIDGQQEGNWMPSLDLSGIENLQNMAGGTEVAFRLYAWGYNDSSNSNTFAFGRNDGPILRGSVDPLPAFQPGVVYTSAGFPGSASSGAAPPSTLGPLIVAPGLFASGVTRGPGIDPRFLSQGFSANDWNNSADHVPPVAPSRQNAIAQGDFFEFAISVEPGHRAGFKSLDLRLRRSSPGAPRNMEWQYSLNGFATPGNPFHAFTYLGRATGDAPDSFADFAYMTSDVPGQDGGNPMPTLDLSGISALQGLKGGSKVTFRLYAWGNSSTSSSNTLGLGRSSSASPAGPIPVLKLGIDVSPAPGDLPAVDGLPAPLPGSAGVTEPAQLELTVIDSEDQEIEIVFLGRRVQPVANDEPFTVVLLPDTQFYSGELHGGSPEMFFAQTDWVVANHFAFNIPFVLHLGDIVQRGDIKAGQPNSLEWAHAAEAMYRLEDPVTTGLPEGVPYAMNVGNHDQEPIWDPDGTTIFYNLYFGVEHFSGKSYYGGHFGSDNDNFYMLFEAGSAEFIAISLEYRQFADAAILEWADALLKAHADRRGIVVTHHLMSPGNPGTWSPYGEAIYETLKDNPNLDFMFGGHITGEGRRVDTYNGNTVISMMQDYQGMPDGGSGFMRLLTFRPERNDVLVNTYSPWLDAHLPHWGNPFSLSYPIGPEVEPFQEIGRVTVPSGSRVELPWDGLEADTGYEWHAVLNENAVATRTEDFHFHTSPSTYTTWRREFFDDGDPDGDRWADPDGDGYANYFEYVFDGDPLRPGTLRGPQPAFALGEGAFVVEYNRLRNTGLDWRSKVSENLIQWTPWQEHSLAMNEDVTDNGDGTETVRLVIVNPGKALFWRLVVQ